MNKNGYFKLDIRDDGTFLISYPPQAGGKTVAIKEATNYLSKYGFNDVDTGALNAVLSSSRETELKVGAPLLHVINEICLVEVSLDKMRAVARFYPPTGGGMSISEEDIMSSLRAAHVKEGISQDAIREFFLERQYCTDYTLAIGVMPTRGSDGKVNYNFSTQKDFKPKYNEDGSVDFKELNTISYVKEGDILATLTPEVPGKDGINILGEKIPCNVVKPGTFKFGKGMHVSEDGMALICDVTGHVTLVEDSVFVNDVMEIEGDVDASTGNVHFDGSCEIKGSVRTGYTVEAGGDVIIGGVVEGATIIAKGSITVKHGVQGGEKAIIKAGGSVYCKFIEGAAEVVAGDKVEADAILNSNVTSVNLVKASGSKGMIIGGKIHSDKAIEVKTVGGDMGANTMLSLGTGVFLNEELKAINAKMAKHKELIDEAVPLVLQMQTILNKGQQIPSVKVPVYNEAILKLKENREAYDRLKVQHDIITRKMQVTSYHKIKVEKDIYPGSVVEIDGIYYNIKEKKGYCYFCKEHGEIYCRSL